MSESSSQRLPVVIIGAGAAGLMAAIHCAGGDGANAVLVVESSRDGGRKILISGGGRCNILPGQLDETRFVTDSSVNTMNKMLRSWPLAEQCQFFEEELGVPLRLEEESGKLFPASNRARDVRDALVNAARERGVEFRFETTVERVEAVGDSESPRWRLHLRGGDTIDASAVVVATGGYSVPNTGSDGAGFRIARDLGHELHETYAALTPLTLQPPRFGDLAGVSLDVRLKAPTARKPLEAVGGFLFTHRGYSGPSVLDVSHLAVRSAERDLAPALPESSPSGPASRRPRGEDRQKVLVQWTPLGEQEWLRELEPRRTTVLAAVRRHMPTRLAEMLLHQSGVPLDRSLAELRSTERKALLEALTAFDLPWTGHEGYRTAEVTGGGVALAEVDPRSLQSRRCPGLFFCGEVLDAFGPIGGYNFLWAWATGRAAGRGARRIASGDCSR